MSHKHLTLSIKCFRHAFACQAGPWWTPFHTPRLEGVQTSHALSLESLLHCQYITTGTKTCCHDFSYTPATSGTTKIHKKGKRKEGCRHTNHTRHTGASSEYVSMVYYQKATQGVNSTDAGPPPVDAQPTSAMSKQDVMLPPKECFGL